MPYMVMQGNIQQLAVDTDITVLRSTGARREEFEAVIPAYIRLEQDPLYAQAYDIVGPWSFEVTFGGESSGIALKWQVVKTDTGAVLFDTNLEWYVPEFFPPMFDENFKVSVRSTDLGQVLICDYIMYYTVKKYSEMEMVQTLESYPVGIL